jgi:hypothetical protein
MMVLDLHCRSLGVASPGSASTCLAVLVCYTANLDTGLMLTDPDLLVADFSYAAALAGVAGWLSPTPEN